MFLLVIIKIHKLAIIIPVPDAVHCTNVNCSDPVHIEKTTRFYIAILGSLQDASSSVFQQAGNGRGWNYSNYSSSLVRLQSGSTGDVYCMCMGDFYIHANSVFRVGLFIT